MIIMNEEADFVANYLTSIIFRNLTSEYYNEKLDDIVHKIIIP